MLHSYDVRMESDGRLYKNIVNDIRVFQDDPNVYKTLDRDLVMHQIAPASCLGSTMNNQSILQNQWKPCDRIDSQEEERQIRLTVIFLITRNVR